MWSGKTVVGNYSMKYNAEGIGSNRNLEVYDKI